MRLHVLAGCRELLRPDLLGATLTAGLIGERIRLAPAFWISQRCGVFYHDFLSDVPDDRRVEIFALSLREAFGTRFQPLVVLPELLDAAEAGGAASTGPEDPRASISVLCRIWSSGHFAQLSLHAIALPAAADPDGSWATAAGITAPPARDRLAALRAACLARGIASGAVETAVIEAGPDLPGFARLYRNAVASQVMTRLVPRLQSQGFATDHKALGRRVGEVFRNWTNRGISPSLPLREDQLDSIADSLFARCI